MAHEATKIQIPLSLPGRAEVSRCLREIEKVDQFFMNANQRKGGTSPTPPRISRTLSSIAELNRLNLLQEADRARIKEHLNKLLNKAPNVHVTFAAEPSPHVLEIVIGWLRQNIHPETLVVVGLQPSIAAGIILRTENKIFDMSLRNHLKGQEPFLTKLIDGVVNG